MSGFEPIIVTRRSVATGAGVISRFTVPDLDAPEVPEELLPDPAELAEAALQVRLEEAREAGFAAGEAAAGAAAAASHAERMATALEAIRTAIEQGAESVSEAAGAAAESLAQLLLAALDAALPEAAARLAPEAAARLAAELRPLLEEGIAVTLTVAPGVAAEAAAKIGLTQLAITEDAVLAPGDAVAAWRGGGARISLEARRAGIAAILTAFDLAAPLPEET